MRQLKNLLQAKRRHLLYNEELKNLGVGLLLSYEEIFLENTGQKKIEEYILFQFMFKIVFNN